MARRFDFQYVPLDYERRGSQTATYIRTSGPFVYAKPPFHMRLGAESYAHYVKDLCALLAPCRG